MARLPLISEGETPEWNGTIAAICNALKSLPKSTRSSVLFGADSDGYVSYLFLKRLLNSHHIRIAYQQSFLTYQYKFTEFLSQRGHCDWDLIVCLDIPAIQELSRFQEAFPHSRFLFVDHHQFRGEVTGRGNLTYINPVYEKILTRTRTPVCLMLFEALRRTNIVRDVDYLFLAVGLLGDSALNDYPELVDWLKKRFSIQLDARNPINSAIGTIARMITAIFQLYPGTDSIEKLEQSYDADAPDLILSDKSAASTIAAFDSAVEFELQRSKHERSELGQFLHYVIAGSAFVSNIVCRRLSQENEHRISMVEFQKGDIVQYEFRYSGSDQCDIPKIIAECGASKYTDSFGGHATACGAIVSLPNRSQFIAALVKS